MVLWSSGTPRVYFPSYFQKELNAAGQYFRVDFIKTLKLFECLLFLIYKTLIVEISLQQHIVHSIEVYELVQCLRQCFATDIIPNIQKQPKNNNIEAGDAPWHWHSSGPS